MVKHGTSGHHGRNLLLAQKLNIVYCSSSSSPKKGIVELERVKGL